MVCATSPPIAALGSAPDNLYKVRE